MTLNLTEMEDKVVSKLITPGATFPKTFEDVIYEEDGRLAKMLKAIKDAYDEFVRGIIEKNGDKDVKTQA